MLHHIAVEDLENSDGFGQTVQEIFNLDGSLTQKISYLKCQGKAHMTE